MLRWQLLIWTVFFNVAPHSGLYSRLLAVLDERTRSVSARHRRHQRLLTSSAIRFSARELHIMHKHELSLSQWGLKEPELPAKSRTADTCCSVCEIWRRFRNVEHKAVVGVAVGQHTELRKLIEAHCKQMKILSCISVTVLTSLPKNMIRLRLVDDKNGRKKVTFMTYYLINMR